MNVPFHRMGVDSGVTIHSDLNDLVSPRKLGAVNGYSLIKNRKIKSRIEYAIRDYFEQHRFSEGLVLKSILATISQPTFPNSWKEVQGKILLNGASGDRAIGHFRRNFKTAKEMDKKFSRIFKDTSIDVSSFKPQPHDCRIFAVEAKNFFNFYHFIIETLHQLTLVPADIEIVHIVSRSEEAKPFIVKWIDQLFPELQGKVKLTHPRYFEGKFNTLTPISGQHLLYQLDGSHIEKINKRAPQHDSWQGYDARKHHVLTLSLNAIDRSLYDFRRRALRRVNETGYRSQLTRIYVARKPGHSRDRKMEGEDKLFALLQELGFVKIYMEDMEPLEQIAAMNSAKCVVLQHGAGLANMIFASPNTHFIEIGTAQTALERWGDFIPLTHVSQCHYHSLFVDMDCPADAGIPVFSKHGLIAPKLTASSIRRIVEIVESCLNETVPGKIAGMVHHAERIEGTQPDSMLWRLIQEQARAFDYDDFKV